MEIGTKIKGRYRILDRLGSGGMAQVYLAHDLILDRDVAVKVMRLDFQGDHNAMRRFQREALAATEIVHPNVVGIYDVGEEDDLQYIVMEYVKGMDLKRYIKTNYPIPFDTVVNMMDQILSAVSVAHKHRIIHRDLKPQNILVDQSGNCKITDFGIAVALSETSMTQTNSLLGSVHYLSPEQARGSMATEQSDIYALGIILYEMLTGEVPFDGESAVAVALQHFQNDIPSIKKFQPNVPQALENVVRHATAKDPHDRYASIQEMRQDLSTVLSASRRDEPVWYPTTTTEEAMVETKVIPPIVDDAIEKTSEEIPVEEEEKPKKKRRWWLWVLLLLIAISGCTSMFYMGGHNISIPNVQGQTVEQATKTLEDAGFTVSSKLKKRYSNKVAEDKVIKTDPKANAVARKGDEIKLYISKGPRVAKIENFKGQNYEDVRRKLIKEGAKDKQIKVEYRMSSTQDKGMIISQSIMSGKLNKDSTITFIVSAGDTMKMPDLSGKTLEEVKAFATDNDLAIVVQYEYSDETPGTVISQDPEHNTNVSIGDTLFVTFAQKRPATQQNNNYNNGYAQNNGNVNRNQQANNNVNANQNQPNAQNNGNVNRNQTNNNANQNNQNAQQNVQNNANRNPSQNNGNANRNNVANNQNAGVATQGVNQ